MKKTYGTEQSFLICETHMRWTSGKRKKTLSVFQTNRFDQEKSLAPSLGFV